MKLIFLILLIFKSFNSYPDTEQTTTISTNDYALSMCEKISTIVVKQNNLIDICTLGREFEISFKLFINKLEFNKNIIEIFAGKKWKTRILRVISHWKYPRIRFASRVDHGLLKARTPKVSVKVWNTIRIVQERLHNDLVRKELKLKQSLTVFF